MHNKLLLTGLCLVLITLVFGVGAAHPGQLADPTVKRLYFPVIMRDEPPTWLGPEGGILVVLAVDPLHPQVIYAVIVGRRGVQEQRAAVPPGLLPTTAWGICSLIRWQLTRSIRW